MFKRTLLAVAVVAALSESRSTAQKAPETAVYGPRPILLVGQVFQAPRIPPRRTPQERQLQEFWANYYRTLAQYYSSLENVDWVSYYHKNGYPIDPRFYNPQGQVPGQMTLVPVHPGVMPPHPTKAPSAPAAPVMVRGEPAGVIQQASWWQFWKKDAAEPAAPANAAEVPGRAAVQPGYDSAILPASAETRTPLVPPSMLQKPGCATGNCPLEAATPKRLP